MPVPVLLKLFAPPSAPVSVSVFAPVSIDEPVLVTLIVFANDMLAVVCNVPPAKASAPVPSAVLAPMETLPALSVVPPP